MGWSRPNMREWVNIVIRVMSCTRLTDLGFYLPGMVVKQKWRSRRDGYVRLRKEILANHNNPQVTAKARRWKYYSRLSFLAPFMEDPV